MNLLLIINEVILHGAIRIGFALDVANKDVKTVAAHFRTYHRNVLNISILTMILPRSRLARIVVPAIGHQKTLVLAGR